MPIYEYECVKCGHVFEAQQSFSDAPLSKCESCRGKVRKLFSAPAIIFKGKGFHCTDYKGNGGPKKAACPSGECPAAESACEKIEDCKGKCAAS